MATRDPFSSKRRKGKGKSKKPRYSRLQKPAGMSLEDWQVELRKQFGVEQKFKLACLGEHPVFSDFHVTNPGSGNTYRVRIRGAKVGDNASLQQFAAPGAGQQAANSGVASVQRDERTGEHHLRVLMPPPEVLTQALDAVGKLLASLRR